MRYPMSGYNDDALTTDGYSIINTQGQAKKTVTTGRTYWLKSVTLTNTHATTEAVVEIWDEAETTPVAPTAANQRLSVIVAPENTTMVEFPAPGLQFLNGCVATQTGGTLGAYTVSTNGYEE